MLKLLLNRSRHTRATKLYYSASNATVPPSYNASPDKPGGPRMPASSCAADEQGNRRCRAGILGSPELFVDLGYLASLGSLRLLGMYLARFVTKLYFS